jgi:aminoacyl tRNA synthase complex-interacting multifunctional protein 1
MLQRFGQILVFFDLTKSSIFMCLPSVRPFVCAAVKRDKPLSHTFLGTTAGRRHTHSIIIMTGGNVVSRSALASITVPSTIGSSDPLVALVVALCPPYQTKVSVTKKTKKDDPPLALTIGPDVLHQRNSILRSLCGMGLHHVLDDYPLLLLGGHSARSGGGASPISSLALSGISSWMSIASSIRGGGGGGKGHDLPTFLAQLDSYLVTRSFVVTSPSPTLADLDLYLAILSGGSSCDELPLGDKINVRRWMEQCGSTLDDMMILAIANAEHSGSPLPVIPRGLTRAIASHAPTFYYGDEDDIDDGRATVVAATAIASAATTAGDGSAISAVSKNSGGGAGDGGGTITDDQRMASVEKRAKKSADKAAKAKEQGAKPKNDGGGGGSGSAPELSISALDIRVGRILKAWEHESSEKLYCEEVDVGESVPRKIASGLRSFYKLDEMQNRTVLVLCNLKARNLGGFPSHGMVLCASNDDHTCVEFAIPPEGSVVGERVRFDGYDGEPEVENKIAKKKIFEAIAPDLKTDENGEVVWRGIKGTTGAGVCKAVNGMANAHVS